MKALLTKTFRYYTNKHFLNTGIWMKDPLQNTEQEDIGKQIQRLFEERGRKALEMAKKAILEEKIECKDAYEALSYFMKEYWNDLQHPTLISIASEAVGGDPDETTLVGAAMILITGAVDIHDDIIDQSISKDSKKTVYGKFGKDIALLVGDALLIKGFKLIHDAGKRIPAEKVETILAIVKEAFFELGDAEALELGLRGSFDITPQRYMQIITMKASIERAQTQIGAIVGCGTQKEVESLGRYGRILGMLAMIRDEFVDMFEPNELRNRALNECLPLPILYALQNPKIKKKINIMFQKEKIVKKDIDKSMDTLIEEIFEAKEVKTLRKTMQELAKKAMLELKFLKKEELRETLKTLILITLQDLQV
jgi:geranylgeranyl pyrophosphate synthase